MLKLHILILLSLSLNAFGIQDQNCFIAFETCEGPNIDNWKQSYFDFEKEGRVAKCYKCENGYYLSNDEKNCMKIEAKIDNCVEYNYWTELICAECNSGYALSSDFKSCIKVEKEKIIGHCINYSQNEKGEFICKKCIDEYFPSNDDKSCMQIKNCLDTDYYYESTNAEKIVYCSSCKSGFAISYDGQSCLQFDGCGELEEGDKQCAFCNYPYFRNSYGQCEISFCNEYNDDNQCIKCAKGYYINDINNTKTCQKIEKENCEELTDDKKKCKTCVGNNEFFVPDAEGNCVIQIIKGCLHYDKDGKCTDCGEEYEKTDEGGCIFKKCPNGEKTREYCRLCKAGYNQGSDGKCFRYDESENSSSGRKKVKYAFLLLLSLLSWKNSLDKTNLILK